MPRLKLKIAYVGKEFAGWQVQPGRRTIQGEIQRALERICGRPIVLHGAGRTDAGVHALGQVAHCDIPESRGKIPWIRALNGILPEDISIVDACITSSAFHARKLAKAKIYSYTLWLEPSYILPNRRPFCWWIKDVDLEKMKQTATLLEGTHDFAAFQNVGTPIKNTVRTIFKIFVTPGYLPQEKIFYFCGDGFLKQMVRNIMGALVWVGRGKLTEKELLQLIETKNRSLLPPTAPSHGLCLEQVLY